MRKVIGAVLSEPSIICVPSFPKNEVLTFVLVKAKSIFRELLPEPY